MTHEVRAGRLGERHHLPSMPRWPERSDQTATRWPPAGLGRRAELLALLGISNDRLVTVHTDPLALHMLQRSIQHLVNSCPRTKHFLASRNHTHSVLSIYGGEKKRELTHHTSTVCPSGAEETHNYPHTHIPFNPFKQVSYYLIANVSVVDSVELQD